MKHAYLILAHGKYEKELLTLVHMIDHVDNDIYIHLDKRSSIHVNNILNMITKSRCFFIDRKKISWGGFSIIDAEMRLLEKAYKSGQYRYYHILSGLDLPVKSQDYIHSYMEKHDGEEFIKLVYFPHNEHPEMRYSQFHFLQDRLIGKERNIWKYIDFSSCYVQKFLGIKRFQDQKMCAGSQWMSITNDCVCYILEHSESILKQYKWTYCCDEYFIPTTIFDSVFYSNISDKGNLRYIVFTWFSKHDLSPKVLTEYDFDSINMPDILFARKFLLPESSLLISDLQSEFDNA